MTKIINLTTRVTKGDLSHLSLHRTNIRKVQLISLFSKRPYMQQSGFQAYWSAVLPLKYRMEIVELLSEKSLEFEDLDLEIQFAMFLIENGALAGKWISDFSDNTKTILKKAAIKNDLYDSTIQIDAFKTNLDRFYGRQRTTIEIAEGEINKHAVI